MNTARPVLATFRLVRDHDVSGISGEGIVAEGVQFSDGWVVTHWLDQPPMNEPKTDVWHHKGTQPITKIHGHGGATRIVWTDDAKQRAVFGAGIAEIYDVPAAMLGTEVEREYLRRRIERALLEAWQARGSVVSHPEEHCASFTAAVMPIVDEVLGQRDRWRATVGRAFRLAYRWEVAHGSAMFLVRAAGAELRDVLDDSGRASGGVVHLEANVQASGLSGVDYVAAAEPEPQPDPVVHLCPPEGRSTMPCCGRLPFEARGDRITIDAAEVTCAQIPTATCGEHLGPCFPEPGARCSAHGDEQCRLCHRNPGNCATSGNCGMWSETGMHWDTCPNRVRGPLADTEA